MNKQKYTSPAISFIDMKSYGIMEIQGESKFGVGDTPPIDIIPGDPPGGEIEAKSIWFDDDSDLWDDDDY